MARKLLIRSNSHPYHVTARGNNKEAFHYDLSETWKLFDFYLSEIASLFGAKIHAFVLMPNHFHLLISTPQHDLGIVMKYFIQSVTKTMNSKTGRSGRVFGAKYHWSLIDSEKYYDCALRYVYQNPLKSSLSKTVEDYPYTTIRAAIGTQNLRFQLSPHVGSSTLVPNGQTKEYLDWLNQPITREQHESIRKGLQKTTFDPLKADWKKILKLMEAFSSPNLALNQLSDLQSSRTPSALNH